MLRLDNHIITDFYCKEVRSIFEFGVPVWHSGITSKMTERIERIQKICINIILCDTEWNISYFVGCTLLNLEPLFYRRLDLCTKFIQKASLTSMHSDFFCRNSNPFHTRHAKPIYREFICRNTRYYNSPLCYLTRLLNSNPVKEYNIK